MLAFIVILVIAVVIYFALFSGRPQKSDKPITPPTIDVHILGCHFNCGYATAEFQKNSKGDYDATGSFYCAYQKKSVPGGSKCPYAEEHPDKLGKSLFDIFEDSEV